MPHPEDTQRNKTISWFNRLLSKIHPVTSPRFPDHLAKLTAKDTQFEWTPQCQFSFEMLKEALMSTPILKYPDTDKPYTIFTDASKYGWAGVLTQEHTTVIDGKQR